MNIHLVTRQAYIDCNFPIVTVEESLQQLNAMSEIALDSETKRKERYKYYNTTNHNPYICDIFILQLGNKHIQFVIDCTTISVLEYKDLLESGKRIIIQNAQFDLQFLYHLGIDIPFIWDTLIAEAILTSGLGDAEDIKDIKKAAKDDKDIAELYAGRSCGLAALTKKYTTTSLNKEIRGLIEKEGFSTRVIEYAAKDIKVLPEIKSKQIKELTKFSNKYGLTVELVRLEMDAVKAFTRMIYNGFKLDIVKYKKEVINKVALEKITLEEELNLELLNLKLNTIKVVNKVSKKIKPFTIAFTKDLFSNTIKSNVNWSSAEQKLGILKTILPELTTTSSKIISKYSEDHKLIEKLVAYNKFKKLEESFGSNLVKKVNIASGKIHTNIWQVLSTGRISMKDPNLSQIPSKGSLGKTIRSGFIPRNEDYVIVGGDYSGFELRIIAELSKDPLWVDTFKSGGDLHSVLCSETFDIPLSDVKSKFYANPDITYRDVQKTINFG